jgi:HEPN domain-containing protein
LQSAIGNALKKRLDEDDHQDAAVHLQQALEKYLKAFLLANGWKLEKPMKYRHGSTKL